MKRLNQPQVELFTFPDHAGVPVDINHAERQIRPAVLIRKNSYENGSESGAETESIMMSIFVTLKMRGNNPTGAIVKALRECLVTGQIPTLKSIAAVPG